VIDGDATVPAVAPPYRRRIELRPSDGVVDAAMEDYIHHFALRLHHDGTTIGAIEVAPQRVPWTTCPVGAAGLRRLEGVRLDRVRDFDAWMGGRSSQCVHTTDLAVLAASSALRGTARTYEVWVTDVSRGRRTAALLLDGRPWATWEIEGNHVVGEGRFAGLPVDGRGFSRWIAEAGADLGPGEAEAAFVLRRGSIIGLSRSIDMDEWTHPDDAHPGDESCHTYRSDVAHVALRNVGTARHTEDDGEGAPIPSSEGLYVRPSDPAA
jgi:hypothetical protein